MTWNELFDRTDSVETTVAEIRETLVELRKRRDDGE